MKYILLICALALVALAASPVEVDRTQVKVSEQDLSKNVEEFVVEVVHIEDDFDENGKVIGERSISVGLKFDVTDDLTVTVNGQPAAYGFSQIQVAARVVSVGFEKDFKPISQVLVHIFVALNKQTDASGNVFHRVVVQARVVEVEGDKVWQADVSEQMIDVHSNGQVIKSAVVKITEATSRLPPVEKPKADQDDEEEKHDDEHDDKKDDEKDDDDKKHGEWKGKHGGKHGHHGKPQGAITTTDNAVTTAAPVSNDDNDNSVWEKVTCTLSEWKHAVMDWYHSLPFVVRVLIAFVVGMLAGFVALSIASCLARACGAKKTCAKNSYDANLRTFAVQYTAVPLEEKAAKKEKESGSAELV